MIYVYTANQSVFLMNCSCKLTYTILYSPNVAVPMDGHAIKAMALSSGHLWRCFGKYARIQADSCHKARPLVENSYGHVYIIYRDIYICVLCIPRTQGQCQPLFSGGLTGTILFMGQILQNMGHFLYNK